MGERLTIVSRSNVQGYYVNYLVRAFLKETETEIHTVFSDTVDLVSPEIATAVKESSVILAVGLPFHESQRNAVTETLTLADNPFSLFFHVATYGDIYMNQDSFHSYVSEQLSPVKQLTYILPELKSFYQIHRLDYVENFLNLYEPVFTALDSYHHYELQAHTMDYIELGWFYREHLARYAKLKASDLIDENRYVLQACHTNREHYIQHVLTRVQAHVIHSTVICFLFAERYENEIAQCLLSFYAKHGYTKIIVLVGKHTRGDDMFHVRTQGVHAGEFAKQLNKGKGKENTAIVFLGQPLQATYTALLQLIPNIL